MEHQQQQPTAAVALADFANLLFTQPPAAANNSPFFLNRAPVSLSSFVERLATYVGCSDEAFVVASAYLRRVFAAHRDLFTPHHAHKLVLACVVVAAKFVDDVTYAQTHYARCGGIGVKELNALERAFFALLGQNAFVSESGFEDARALLLGPGRDEPQRTHRSC